MIWGWSLQSFYLLLLNSKAQSNVIVTVMKLFSTSATLDVHVPLNRIMLKFTNTFKRHTSKPHYHTYLYLENTCKCSHLENDYTFDNTSHVSCILGFNIHWPMDLIIEWYNECHRSVTSSPWIICDTASATWHDGLYAQLYVLGWYSTWYYEPSD